MLQAVQAISGGISIALGILELVFAGLFLRAMKKFDANLGAIMGILAIGTAIPLLGALCIFLVAKFLF